MPLARYAMYAQGIDVWCAPTWDNSDVWVATLRHIAKEGRVYVIGATPCLRGSDVPADVPGRDRLWGGEDDWMSKGNSAIVGPEGEILAGPLVGEEGIVTAEIDPARARAVRYQFDPVGHYSRPDVFRLIVEMQANVPAVASGPSAPQTPAARAPARDGGVKRRAASRRRVAGPRSDRRAGTKET
jgi:nitrilase